LGNSSFDTRAEEGRRRVKKALRQPSPG